MSSEYFLNLLILIGIYSIFAIALQLILGFSGIFNLGCIAFFGIGAYSTAMMLKAETPFYLCITATALISSLSGLLLSMMTTKLDGEYRSLATLSFSFVIYSVFLNFIGFSSGPFGISGIPRPYILGIWLSDNFRFMIMTIIIASMSYFTIYRICKSPFGKVLEAMRDDKLATKSLGKNIHKLEDISFSVSAMFSGIAGSIYATYVTFIDPSVFALSNVIFVLLIVVIGGLASLPGTILATAIVILLPEPLRFIGLPPSVIAPTRQMIYALLLIAIINYYPKGLMGKIKLD